MRTPEQEKELDRYLQHECAYLGAEGIAQLLQRRPEEKRYFREQVESDKLKACLLRRVKVVGALGPLFVPHALAPDSAPSQTEARRPFQGYWSSHEAGIRAEVLPRNPYFREDAAVVRRVLGLPGSGLEPVPGEAISRDYWWWKEWEPLHVGSLADLWETVHEAKAGGKAYRGPEFPPFLPQAIREYGASPDLVPHADQAPPWLLKNPQFPWGQPAEYRSEMPLHRFVAVLLHRYGLPPRLFDSVRHYLFSNQVDDLKPPPGWPLGISGLSPGVEFVRQPDGSRYTITLTVQGIDAFTTREEWVKIWNKMVAPAQRSWQGDMAQIEFRQQHGRFPNLSEEYPTLRQKLRQRAKPPFTRPNRYLPLWERMQERRLTLDEALKELDPYGEHLDRRNARRGVKRLEELMRPTD